MHARDPTSVHSTEAVILFSRIPIVNAKGRHAKRTANGAAQETRNQTVGFFALLHVTLDPGGWLEKALLSFEGERLCLLWLADAVDSKPF